MATAVTGADRPEIMSRSHASSTCWMRARTPWSATRANTTAVSASTAAVSAASRAGAARTGSSLYPGHGAPRPHSARPSVFLMCSTSLARGTKPTAPLTGIASSGDAPGAKLNR